jgi:large repetitive protein
MRTSLRVLFASVSTLLVAAFTVLIPTPAQAVNGVHTINVASRSCTEGNAGTSNCAVTVSLAGGVNFGPTISATIVATDDSARKPSDYTYNNQTVQWASGESGDRTVNVTIVGDTSHEPAESFTMSVSNPTQASAGTPGTITITNDDGTVPTLVITAPAPAAEGNANNVRTVKVSVNNPSDQAMSVNYATSDGTATSDTAKGAVDYTPITTKTLNWPGNDGSEKTIDITVRGDTIAEGDERFFLNFGSPNNVGINANQNPANIDLLNDDGTAADVPKLTIENIPDKTEGDTSQTTQTVTVTLSPAVATALPSEVVYATVTVC